MSENAAEATPVPTPGTNGTAKKPPRRPPPRLSFASVDHNNIGTLRKLNSVIFPIIYTERFYADTLVVEHADYCKLVYYNDIPVGTVCARLEKGTKEGEHRLYLMTMGILAPYRSRGLGTYALQHILKSAASSSPKSRIKTIYLHVQISNGDAKRFYEHHGFKEVGIAEDYYKKIEPKQAWIMEYEVPPLSKEEEESAARELAKDAKSAPAKGVPAKGTSGGGKGGKKGKR